MANADEAVRDALLLDPGTRVTCPKCEHEFSLEEGFARKSLEAIESASADALARVQSQARALEEKRAGERAAQSERLLRDQLENLQAVLEAQRAQSAEALEQMRTVEKEAAAARERALQERLKEQSSQLAAVVQERQALDAKAKALAAQEAGIAERVEREAAVRAQVLTDQEKTQLSQQLQAQAVQLKSLQDNELQLRRDRQALEARQQQLELDVQRRLDEERKQIAESVRASEAEKSKLREADLQKKLDDVQSHAAEMQRQLEQGSQQSQGEVLELLLEQALAEAFPFDTITEVKKGVRGGDAVHTVMNRSGQVAGVVLWEAKRAQNWSRAWPAKLKSDLRDCGAVTGVIVTTAFPPEWPAGSPFGLHEGVWLTTATAAIAMAAVLREGLIEAHKARVAAANKGEKMEAVYDYLTSPQFAHKLKAVYEVFENQRKELQTERTTTMQRWKRREKQIEVATVQLIGIAGDLQGLAQQDLPQLELAPKEIEGPEDEDDDAGEGEEEKIER
jgi:hypothetical protein